MLFRSLLTERPSSIEKSLPASFTEVEHSEDDDLLVVDDSPGLHTKLTRTSATTPADTSGSESEEMEESGIYHLFSIQYFYPYTTLVN